MNSLTSGKNGARIRKKFLFRKWYQSDKYKNLVLFSFFYVNVFAFAAISITAVSNQLSANGKSFWKSVFVTVTVSGV